MHQKPFDDRCIKDVGSRKWKIKKDAKAVAAVLGLDRVDHSLPTRSTGLPTENCGLPWEKVIYLSHFFLAYSWPTFSKNRRRPCARGRKINGKWC